MNFSENQFHVLVSFPRILGASTKELGLNNEWKAPKQIQIDGFKYVLFESPSNEKVKDSKICAEWRYRHAATKYRRRYNGTPGSEISIRQPALGE
jgi:hypothetical protein